MNTEFESNISQPSENAGEHTALGLFANGIKSVLEWLIGAYDDELGPEGDIIIEDEAEE